LALRALSEICRAKPVRWQATLAAGRIISWGWIQGA
jgi:hypothetical protein